MSYHALGSFITDIWNTVTNTMVQEVANKEPPADPNNPVPTSGSTGTKPTGTTGTKPTGTVPTGTISQPPVVQQAGPSGSSTMAIVGAIAAGFLLIMFLKKKQ